MRLLIYSALASFLFTFKAFAYEQLVLQYAGDIGKFSLGYGKDLTDYYRISFHYGYVPANELQNKIETYTIKNNFSLWSYDYQQYQYTFYTGAALFHVPGNKYKTHEYSSTPDNYYRQSSIRGLVYIGHEMAYNKTNSIYLESGINDVWLINAANNDSVDIQDHVSLALGYNYRF